MPSRPSTPQVPLIIAGMHRSGTSLTTGLLQQAGLHVGEELMQSNSSNQSGHFENMEFYRFHQAVLRSQGANEKGWSLQDPLLVEETYIAEAKALIERNTVMPYWGWKDPRTVLFLEFWANLLPNSAFLMVYRSPWEVVDSLYRRGDSIFQEQPELAVKIWLHYNRKLLNLLKRFPDRCLLVNLTTITTTFSKLVQVINKRFNLNLNKNIVSTLYQSDLLHRTASENHHPSQIYHYFPEAIDLYDLLETKAWLPKRLTPDRSWRKRAISQLHQIAAFEHWRLLRTLEKRNQNLTAQGQHKAAEIKQLQARLQKTTVEHQTLVSETDSFKQQLQQVQTELAEVRSQQQHTQEQLKQSELQSQHFQTVLEEKQVSLNTIETHRQQLQTELEQVRSELERSQTTHQQTQSKLQQAQSCLNETEAVLEQSQSELQQALADLEVSQTQLHETQALSQQFQFRCHATAEQLERTELQLYQTRDSLTHLQEQYQETQDQLEQTMQQLEIAKAEFNETQSQFYKKEQLAEELQAQLITNQEQAELKLQQMREEMTDCQAQLQKAEDALDRSQIELERYRYQIARSNFQTALAKKSASQRNLQYHLLVWDAWYAYCSGEPAQTIEYLKQSLHCTTVPRSAAIASWIKTFDRLSHESNHEFDVDRLIQSQEWQLFICQFMAKKVLITR